MNAPASPSVSAPRFVLSIGNTAVSAEIRADIGMVEISEDMNTPAMLEFSINLWDGMRMILKESYLEQFALGTPLKLALGIDEEKTIFTGEVTALEPEFGGLDGPDSLKVQAYNRLHRLKIGTRQRTFEKMTYSDIAASIASDVGLTAAVDKTATKHAHVVQESLTDLEFLLRLARPINYEVSVDDKTLNFRKCREDKDPVVSLTYRRDLMEFTPRQRAVPQGAKVEVRGWDVKTKKPILGKAGAGDETSKMGGKKTGAEISASAFGASARTHTITAETLVDADEATQIAKAWYNRQQSNFVEAQGECVGSPQIRAGVMIEIAGVGKTFSGTYYVVSAKHNIGASGYRTRFEVTRNSL